MTQLFWVAQRQPDNDSVEILWQCNSYEQADDECQRINSGLANAGIPGDYYAFVIE
jgi:hypothetical protein